MKYLSSLFSSFYRAVCVSLIVSVAFVLLPTSTFAAVGKIQSYTVDLTLNTENTVHVIETIVYDFGSTSSQHGIFRHVPIQFSDGTHPLQLTAITDETGSTYPYSDESDAQNTVWKIGDPDKTITGVHTYILRYSFEAPVGLFSEQMDRFAWNAIGTEWEVPTEASVVTLHLPDTVQTQDVSEQRCFVGMAGLGIGDGCATSVDAETNTLIYTLERRLKEGEGLTIQVDLPRVAVDSAVELTIANDLGAPVLIDGVLVNDGASYGQYVLSPGTHRIESRRPFFQEFADSITVEPGQSYEVTIPRKPYVSYIVLGYMLPVLIFLAYITAVVWFFIRYGKEPNASKVVVTEFEVPAQLSPLEISAVVKQKIELTAISSHLVFLATLGIIKIIQKEPEGAFKKLQKPTYTFELLRSLPAIGEKIEKHTVIEADEILMEMVFTDRDAAIGTQVDLKDCHSRMSTQMTSLQNAVFDAVITRGYFYLNPRKSKDAGFVIHVLACVAAIVIAAFIYNAGLSPLWFIVPAAPIIGLFFLPFMGQRTKKGAEVYRQLKGYQKYLAVAEKSRIEFFNDPKKYQQLFESVLPFAMVLGVEEKWAKHFEGLYTAQPGWYSSTDPFTPVVFAMHLQQFQSATKTTIAPPSSSSGMSGGGGFSGGGFGGGGGGSW